LDKNVGLLFAASSQFFLAASNICVKWLNNLDESELIPILEVRDIFWVVVDTDSESDGEYINLFPALSQLKI
jgi:hypothetical protein